LSKFTNKAFHLFLCLFPGRGHEERILYALHRNPKFFLSCLIPLTASIILIFTLRSLSLLFPIYAKVGTVIKHNREIGTNILHSGFWVNYSPDHHGLFDIQVQRSICCCSLLSLFTLVALVFNLEPDKRPIDETIVQDKECSFHV